MRKVLFLTIFGLMGLGGCSGSGTDTGAGSISPTVKPTAQKTCPEGYIYSATIDGCYAVSYQKSCDDIPEDVCGKVGDCIYDSDDKRCKPVAVAVCIGLTSEEACTKLTHCTWDSFSNQGSSAASGVCLSLFTFCASITSKSACNNFSCSWLTTGTDQGKCVSLTSGCASVITEKDCNDTQTCHWNSSKNSCQTGFATCSSYAQSSCELSNWCTWDSKQGACLSRTSSFCSTAINSSTCGVLKGCTWDSVGSKCLASWSFCSSVSDQAVCEASAFCGYSKANGCVNKLWCLYYKDC